MNDPKALSLTTPLFLTTPDLDASQLRLSLVDASHVSCFYTHTRLRSHTTSVRHDTLDTLYHALYDTLYHTFYHTFYHHLTYRRTQWHAHTHTLT
jgi:hypothetical protein